MTLQEKKNPNATLQGATVTFLYHGLSSATEVQMVKMEDIKVETTGVQKIIELTFKHQRIQRNKGLIYYVPSKCFLMFSRYVNEICQDIVAAGNVQFLKKWNNLDQMIARITSTYST